MDIKVRFMTFAEFDKYQDYVDELNEKGVKPNKVSRLASVWVMKNIYNVDIEKTNLRPGVVMEIVTKTVELTFKGEEEAVKN